MAGKLAQFRCGYLFGSFVENNPFHGIADIPAIEHVGYIRQRDYHEAAGIGRKCGLDPLLDGKERQWIFFIDPVGVTHRDADLPGPPQSLFDQPLMSGMKRLIAPDKQRRRPLWTECRPKQREDLFGPELWRPIGKNTDVKSLRGHEHPICIFKSSGLDPIDPDDESVTEGGSRLGCWANEIGDHRAAGFDHPIAHPAHTAGVLDAILMAETKIARQIGAYGVGVKYDRAKQRGKRGGERCLTGAGKSHDEDFALHFPGFTCSAVRPTLIACLETSESETPDTIKL